MATRDRRFNPPLVFNDRALASVAALCATLVAVSGSGPWRRCTVAAQTSERTCPTYEHDLIPLRFAGVALLILALVWLAMPPWRVAGRWGTLLGFVMAGLYVGLFIVLSLRGGTMTPTGWGIALGVPVLAIGAVVSMAAVRQ